MSDQPTLFDLSEAVAAGERAMDDVAANTDAAWALDAWETLVWYLEEHKEFFVDDFWRDSGLEEPREARALGPIVQRAARQKLIVGTGRSRPSVRSHGSGKPIWLSNIYKEQTL
jgi:hypothetical protein